jgi:hypothetical protein
MIKQPITYQDYNGVTRTENHYFNLSIDEIAELQGTVGGGDLETLMQMMIDKKDIVGMIGTFKKVMQLAYGVQSEDGRRFIKTPQAWDEFHSSNAFNELFFELLTDAEKSSNFIIGMLPGDFDAKMAKLKAAQDGRSVTVEDAKHEKYERTVDDYSREELLEMDQELFNKLVGTDPVKMDKAHLVIAMQRRSLGRG